MRNTTVVLRYTSNYRKSEYLTAVYDKRDNFNFDIVPYLSSNIPSGPAYGVYISQLVRIGRIYTQFARRHYKLTQCLIHQGFRYSASCIAFRKFAKKYTQVSEKYGCSIRKHIEDGVCLPVMDPFLSRHVTRFGNLRAMVYYIIRETSALHYWC